MVAIIQICFHTSFILEYQQKCYYHLKNAFTVYIYLGQNEILLKLDN